MLKRIHSLRNIGRFKNCSSGNLEFGRLTILYGRNTYGKSTLGDVFASIQENDGGLINSRMTIPHDGNTQHIRLSLLPPNATKEVPLTYENDAWTEGLPTGVEIRTFDDGFIHRNVFVARNFNRDTKENFSAFVLGQQGVQQANAIAGKKRARQKASRERNQLENGVFKDVDDLKSFLELSPTGTLEESEAKLQTLQNDHVAVRKQQDQIEEIQARDKGTVLTWSTDFSDGLKGLNQTLGLGHEAVHKDAKAMVAQHISYVFHQPQGAEQWIRQGIRQNKGELCQFCGQTLTEDAHKLLDLYRSAFDDAFNKHEAAVVQRLTTALHQAADLPVSDAQVAVAKNRAAFSGYHELKYNDTYTYAASKVAELGKVIEAELEAIANELPDALNRLRTVSTRKQGATHVALEPVDESSICFLETQICMHVSDYNRWLRICNTEIAAFKKCINTQTLNSRLEKIEADVKAERRNNNRIILSSQCSDYIALSVHIDSLDNDISSLEKKLQLDQSDFLKKFFKSLNGWFKRFGSYDFTLDRGETKQGHTPLYFLKVKFKGEDIDELALGQVFSESDRRALALAVFWTQLKLLPEAELEKQIVVLDDPLTSFDDQRVTAVHCELAATVENVRQIIVLSHYRHDIEMFLQTFRNHLHARLLILVAGGVNGTGIEAGNPREFVLTEQQKAHERMTAFGDGDINTHSSGDLRVFFENELDSRFAAHIAQHKLAALQLGEKIEKLFDHGVIAEDVKKQCHNWRDVLNPSHHSWSGADLENQRNTVRCFLDFVYNRLIRKQ